ncbi:MAG: glycosyltransferase, partial [Caldilineaceae bacterium]|nr:glycosyltransferase [Caldilineaceae bacterium]
MTAYGNQLTRLNQRRVLGPLAGTPVFYHATEHLLPRLPVPTVLTVHDLIFERYPAHHTWRNVQFLKRAMPAFVRAADVVIAVSEHTKRDLVELYATPPAKIRVVHEGVDAHFAPASPDAVAAVRARYGLTRSYLLMVGTLEPRKNHLTAMAALARLKAAGQDVTLAVAGGHGWRFEPV